MAIGLKILYVGHTPHRRACAGGHLRVPGLLCCAGCRFEACGPGPVNLLKGRSIDPQIVNNQSDQHTPAYALSLLFRTAR
jgi:hypothetical protein